MSVMHMEILTSKVQSNPDSANVALENQSKTDPETDPLAAPADIFDSNTLIDKTKTSLASKPWLKDMLKEIREKQYSLYSWNDSKANSLLTSNSLLLAAIGLRFKECLNDVLALMAISSALLSVVLSLCFCLRQVIPQGSSGKSGGGKKPILAALSGITSFSRWEEYHDALCNIEEPQEFIDCARQTYGMAHNNCVSRDRTTKGIWLTYSGIFFLVIASIAVILSTHGVHVLGSWKSEDSAGAQADVAAPVKIPQKPRSPVTAPTQRDPKGNPTVRRPPAFNTKPTRSGEVT